MSLVLIVDDEEPFRKMARRMLEAAGHQVVEAATGEECIRQFHDLSPDIIVTDIVMPGKSGIEAILQIRAEDPSVRIIAVSGGGGVATGDFLSAARQAGANQALQKPFRADDLVNALDDGSRP
jgi:CheY-like chemotaxis protein